MCGRFALTVDGEELADKYGFDALVAAGNRYNIAPGQDIWTIAREDDAPATPRALGWGLVPRWAKDPKIGHRMINARAETVAEKPAYRAAFRHRRCLILCDGYYEWQAAPDGKQPYFITREDGKPFSFAGLWDEWRPRDETGDVRATCTILTTDATPALAPIHGRMPVVLDAEGERDWLRVGDDRREPLSGLLAALETLPLAARPVSRHVNSPRNDDPGCIAPLEEQ